MLSGRLQVECLEFDGFWTLSSHENVFTSPAYFIVGNFGAEPGVAALRLPILICSCDMKQSTRGDENDRLVG